MVGTGQLVIRPSTSGPEGFHCGAIVSCAAWGCVCSRLCGFRLSFSLGACLLVDLQGHQATLFFKHLIIYLAVLALVVACRI